MKKFLQFFFAAFFITAMFSCQKEFAIVDLPPNNTDSSGHNSGDTSVGSGSYQPLTKGTYWKYKDSLSGTITTQTVTDVTRIIDSITYTAIVNTDGSRTDTSYFSNNLINYYIFGVVGNSSNSGTFLFNYLNDTIPVGNSWEYVAGQGNGLTANIKATVIGRALSLTVNNVNYTNVVRTDLEFSYDLIGPVLNYEFYVAKDIGIIKVRSVGVGATQGFSTSADLIEYKIQ